jgi:hypothetical protein
VCLAGEDLGEAILRGHVVSVVSRGAGA